MFRFIAAAVLVACLASCASTTPQYQIVALATSVAPPGGSGSVAPFGSTKAWAKCESFGYKPGTQWFQSCLNIQGGGKPASSLAVASREPYPVTASAPRVVTTYSSPPGTSCVSPNYYGSISCTTGLRRTQLVSGYYRKNGTYVAPYYRSHR